MSLLDEMKGRIKERLPELDVVIGWQRGFDPLHATPLFMRGEEDVDRLVLDPLCVHNLATYLTGLRDKKVGVVVKGCDSRSVIELLQEKLLDRENITVFGFPCEGVVSLKKIAREVDLDLVEDARVEGDTVKVTVDGGEKSFPLAEVAADKCGRCRYHNALLSDEFVGEPVTEPEADEYADVAEFESRPLEERAGHWREAMQRCIRCYACRNACPLCVCRDHCVAHCRDPHWITEQDTVDEKWFFQVIHAMHLAGRCTECGECERACPVGIPLLLLKRKLNKEVEELFDYRAGTKVEATPPLMAFQVEEENINERGW
ncbi:4Fe-4S dicluster domain-containing protein [Desulfohalovibrio reitneri]|uniref:4Fe-4S dicluster domain-containing protein n=1 Tax=Desulfohalovibrio reitneri TaxID=1307759 RepID=UPI0004A6AD2E|nr:4Fe-4S dicluster domain-containing protein [Desulfohalovibrio reitneri]